MATVGADFDQDCDTSLSLDIFCVQNLHPYIHKAACVSVCPPVDLHVVVEKLFVQCLRQ